MARMYSRKKGKSGSKKPLKKAKLTWVRYKPKEIELLITKLAKEKRTPSQIGMYLRDVYGIPDVQSITKRKITKIIKEKNLASEIPEDLMALIRKSIALRKHMEKNHKDQAAKHGLTLTESKIKRLVKYYKKIQRLASEWKYEPSKIRLYTE